MNHLLQYWYLRSPNRFITAAQHAIQTLDGQIAVRDTLHNLNKPLFQDYTIQGRIIGVFLRLARAAMGLGVYLLVAVAYAGLFVLWLSFPIFCLVSLVGSVVSLL